MADLLRRFKEVKAKKAALCEACRKVPFDSQKDFELRLGPFERAIDETDCALCQVLRLATRYQDGHPSLLLQAQFSPKRIRAEKFLGYGEKSESLTIAILERKFAAPRQYPIYTMKGAVEQTIKWTDTCVKDHGKGCSFQGDPLCDYLIDVVERRIRPVTELLASHQRSKYFALSYVLGNADILKLTASNLSKLVCRESLHRGKIPKTFNDAIEFTRECGWRYIWIDALCIMGSDGRQTNNQIDLMDKIYSNADLVLVALLGSTPNFGLYPKQVTSRHINGRRLTTRSETGSKNISILDTRAWTFQEKHLARRALFFDSTSVTFRCSRSNVLFEADERGNFRPSSFGVEIELSMMSNFLMSIQTAQSSRRWIYQMPLGEAYETLVEDYTSRYLTYPDDIERAFAGVSSVLAQGTGSPVVHGLPTALLPFCLFWKVYVYKARKVHEEPIPQDRRLSRLQLPTYSWTSKTSQRHRIAYDYSSYRRYRSLVNLYEIESSNATHAIDATATELLGTSPSTRWQADEKLTWPQSRPLREHGGPDILHFVTRAIDVKDLKVQFQRRAFSEETIPQFLEIFKGNAEFDDTFQGRIYLDAEPSSLEDWDRPISPMPSKASRTLLAALMVDEFGNQRRSSYLCLVVSYNGEDARSSRIGTADIRTEFFDESEPFLVTIRLA